MTATLTSAGHLRRMMWLAAAMGLGGLLWFVVSGAGAHAQTIDPSTEVGTGAATIKDEALQTIQTVLPYAAVLVAAFLAWRLAKRFVKA